MMTPEQENQEKAGEQAASPAETSQNKENPFKKVEWRFSRKATITTGIIVAVLIILAALAYRYKGLVIAATINGHPITRVAVIRELEKEGGSKVLDTIINNTLIENAAKQKNIKVSDDEVNQYVNNLEQQLATQKESLVTALAQQGMTIDDFKLQVKINKELQQLLADKIQVSDDEINKFIKDNPAPSGEDAQQYKSEVQQELQQNKLSTAAQDYVAQLRSQAKIKTYVNY